MSNNCLISECRFLEIIQTSIQYIRLHVRELLLIRVVSLVHYLERNLCIRMNAALLRFLNIYVRTDLRAAPNVLPNVHLQVEF